MALILGSIDIEHFHHPRKFYWTALLYIKKTKNYENKKTSHRLGEILAKHISNKDNEPKHTKNSENPTIRKQPNPKNGPKILIHTLPKKLRRWQLSTLRYAHYHVTKELQIKTVSSTTYLIE